MKRVAFDRNAADHRGADNDRPRGLDDGLLTCDRPPVTLARLRNSFYGNALDLSDGMSRVGQEETH